MLGDSENPADGRLTHKDVDAVYLGDVTHVSVNLWDADNWKSADLMECCFQMECLYQNDEISCNTMQNLLRNGIGCFRGNAMWTHRRRPACVSAVVFTVRSRGTLYRQWGEWGAPSSNGPMSICSPQQKCCSVWTRIVWKENYWLQKCRPLSGQSVPCRQDTPERSGCIWRRNGWPHGAMLI